MMRLICLFAGFVCGSIPFGYIIGKLNHVDVTKVGSGNIGSTNVQRNLGWKAGLCTLFCDMMKAIIPMFIMTIVYKNAVDGRLFVSMWTGIGAILGHDFSPWLSFKGGKGVATSCAVILFLHPYYFLIAVLSFVILVAVTKHISTGSMVGSVIFFVTFILSMPGRVLAPVLYGNNDPAVVSLTEVTLIAALIALLIIVRHKDNIIRLFNGTESEFHIKKQR